MDEMKLKSGVYFSSSSVEVCGFESEQGGIDIDVAIQTILKKKIKWKKMEWKKPERRNSCLRQPVEVADSIQRGKEFIWNSISVVEMQTEAKCLGN